MQNPENINQVNDKMPNIPLQIDEINSEITKTKAKLVNIAAYHRELQEKINELEHLKNKVEVPA
jgi:phage shock protein A